MRPFHIMNGRCHRRQQVFEWADSPQVLPVVRQPCPPRINAPSLEGRRGDDHDSVRGQHEAVTVLDDESRRCGGRELRSGQHIATRPPADTANLLRVILVVVHIRKAREPDDVRADGSAHPARHLGDRPALAQRSSLHRSANVTEPAELGGPREAEEGVHGSRDPHDDGACTVGNALHGIESVHTERLAGRVREDLPIERADGRR
jgi:hypothetical protein